MLKSSTHLNRKTGHFTSWKRLRNAQKKKNARAKRAKLLFSIVKCANLRHSCSRRRRGYLSSPMITPENAAFDTLFYLAMDENEFKIC